ncbi:phosphatase PAP2 family protein [Bifidobacterium eulemuris]|uniref:PAP2 family phosphoesterase n=1 Tax=Bifidobacterium eulemuris TaxID=1765219 RepID=A0A261G0H4_9BIFI|nr:phosphatase PAP2 family protein [Bifidobacterium eulemuris]OZG64745.1 PAP2 family phosphoesterase [Bifidobacterium eulemuris]QOL32490.1 phosphatase PAP2 family protein [Bifidobacterium eulemuris]
MNDEQELDRGLTRLDPLAIRPRLSGRVGCLVLAAVFLAAAFGIWWLGVCTAEGQSYEDMVWTFFDEPVTGWLGVLLDVVGRSWVVIAISCVLGVSGLVCAAVRRRWWLLGQMAVFAAFCAAAELLKDLLPRPFLINTESRALNSAPSGHTILAAAAGMLLVLAVPRVCRALAALLAAVWSALVGASVIVAQWHRPCDVVMALLLVGGIAMLTMAFTRRSGMDAMGSRASSAGVQIVGSVLLTAGLMAMVYAAYIVWQVLPGLSVSASWSLSGAVVSSMVLVAACAAVVFASALAMRQVTASPLTRIGLIGAPPAPPAPTSR